MAAALDWMLGLTLAWLAWRVLAERDLLRAVIHLIALGALAAVAWVRLGALDVALAEAAVGSGLTGALLLAALARLRQPSGEKREPGEERGP
ncbi:MAG: Na(+)/H(+) antiporter subunit B [Thermoanaerobaculaceae bacterium]